MPKPKPIIDDTHDPKLESWVESANDPATDFPIQNLPLCAVEVEDDDLSHAAVRIGDEVLLLGELPDHMLPGAVEWTGVDASFACELDASERRELRAALSELLRKDNPTLRDNARLRAKAMFPAAEACFAEPIRIVGDYTDFYASIHHATNIGSMFRPDNPLLPNYKWIPIGYHGRASSIVPSGTPIKRPRGQTKADDADAPVYGPCRLLDYEMEVGFFVAQGNELGETIPIDKAEEHILGMCLVNDWSARDMQKWEYQPLGPFLAKSFATTLSPYIVTMEALAPFRCAAFARDKDDPRPLPHLHSDDDQRHGGVDLTLEVYISSKQMRDKEMDPVRLSRGSFKDMYWTIAQLLTHHASNGCNMQPGDLLASGTVSGVEKDSRGSMLELTWRGSEPIELPTGETRKFLADGDEVIMRGYCEREGFRRIGFGECRGIVAPAE